MRIGLLLLPVFAVVFSGCGQDDGNKLETPHEVNRLTSGIFKAIEKGNNVGAARQIEKLKVHYPDDLKLARLHRMVMDNIDINHAQEYINKGELGKAMVELRNAIQERGESIALDTALKDLSQLILLKSAVSGVAGSSSATELKLYLDKIDAVIKRYPEADSLKEIVAARRAQQKQMDRVERQMALFSLLSDSVNDNSDIKELLDAEYDFANQSSKVPLSKDLLQ